ncbi:MAG: SUMF1/EgtB/PvdO family nonheme iron enzyme [Nitrospinae bacterium]|nr:SUMF1/EgtB/PvdO family nonheme iron enzyme [Nitrospinota bacterium]
MDKPRIPLTVYLTLFLTALSACVAQGAELPRRITGLDGAPLLLVPAGEFVMGSSPGGYIFGDNETPRRRIFLKAFYIDKYEVTNRRFRKFFTPVDRYAGSFEEPDQPVVGVTWFQARAYCGRVGRRLPTEAQWEKAARGADGRVYPWGDERATCARAVMGGVIPSCRKGFATWSVGSRPMGASPYGAMDMAGNAMEWVADWYRGNFYARMPSKDPRGPDSGSLRVLRGGAWFNSRFLMRSAFRTGFAPYESNHGVGFRCARPAVVGVVQRPGAGG